MDRPLLKGEGGRTRKFFICSIALSLAALFILCDNSIDLIKIKNIGEKMAYALLALPLEGTPVLHTNSMGLGGGSRTVGLSK